MKTIDDLMETFCNALINTKNKEGVSIVLLAYTMMLRGEM